MAKNEQALDLAISQYAAKFGDVPPMQMGAPHKILISIIDEAIKTERPIGDWADDYYDMPDGVLS